MRVKVNAENKIMKRLIVGISGASGIMIGVRLLEVLRDLEVQTHLIMTKPAEATLGFESELQTRDVLALATNHYGIKDITAAISSGSFVTDGMIVAPCSVRTMSEIATGVTSNLLTRSADVVLKERRRLTLIVRETPLHTGHLRTMTALSEMGAIIAPPVPAFYQKPESVEDIIDQIVARTLDLYGLAMPGARRWGEDLP
jgi:4-hydroxy-3-polyprenylbenzoate decarboxylase